MILKKRQNVLKVRNWIFEANVHHLKVDKFVLVCFFVYMHTALVKSMLSYKDQ